MSVTLVDLENGQLADASQVMENFNALRAAVEEAVSPYAAGDLKLSAATSVAAGWFACEGQAVSRTTYKTLFEAIGTAFGEGDKATTFNVPDYRERVPVGIGGAFTRGAKGGAGTVALSVANLPAHAHSGKTAVESNGHRHESGTGKPFLTSTSFATGATGADIALVPYGVGTTATTEQQSATHTHTITSEGGGTAHSNLQPYTVCGVWIKH